MGKCVSTTNSKKSKGGSNEDKFKSMREEQTVNQKGDLVVKKGDFIIERRGQNLTDYYRVNDQVIGEGAFGKVQKCFHKSTNEVRAVKILDKSVMDKKEKVRLQFEIDILKNLDHPNIVKLYEVFEDKSYIYLVTELCTGGELFDEIIVKQHFSEVDAAKVIQQVLSSVSYCHKQKVVHRDLKPENILLDSKNNDIIKIIDFGTSQVFQEDQKLHQALGTPYYIAPEVLQGEYDEKCDVWSIGVILFILLCGQPPFNGANDKEILKRVKEGKYSYSDNVWKKRSDLAKDLIDRCLTLDPEQRISAEKALEHDWIRMKVKEQFDSKATNDALKNLKSFRSEEKLQQAALTFIVCNLSTKKEQEELYKSFKALDRNGDGKISKQELYEGYKQIYTHLSEDQIREEVDNFFRNADFDGNGELEYSEWQVATINKRSILQEEKLKGAFQLFDKDGSGSINANEIKEVLGIGKKFGDEKIWNDIIREVDVNGDGEISFDEFKIMMQKFLAGDESPKK